MAGYLSLRGLVELLCRLYSKTNTDPETEICTYNYLNIIKYMCVFCLFFLTVITLSNGIDRPEQTV